MIIVIAFVTFLLRIPDVVENNSAALACCDV